MNLCKRLFFVNGLLKYLVIFIILCLTEVDFFQHLAIFINVMLRTLFIYFYFLNNLL